ncbi:MAG: tetratricopeptide repeat protein [Flavobacteriales bacterium]|nr:tetratricopeptide repeat protein [Flavobacteriales bacterium]
MPVTVILLRWIRLGLVLQMLAVAYVVPAQSTRLVGVVVVQNSQYETGTRQFVQGASVRTPFAKAAISDHEGRFALDLYDLQPGTFVQLHVTHATLTPINANELTYAIVGRTEPLVIVMSDPQRLADAQADYYRIALDGISRIYRTKMAALTAENVLLTDRLAVFNADREQQAGTLLEAMDALSEERRGAEGNARELADRFAAADLDGASEMFRTALEHIRNGELDRALALLDEQRLEAGHAAALAKKEAGRELIGTANEAIRQVYHSNGLKIDVLEIRMDHRAALDVIGRMRSMLETDPEAFEETAAHQLSLRRADLLETMGRYADAAEEYRHGRDLVRDALGPDDIAQVTFLASWAVAATHLDSLDRALDLVNEGAALMKGHEDRQPLLFADLEAATSDVLSSHGDPVAAAPHEKKGLALRKEHLPPGHIKTLTSLHNLAIIHNALGENEEAIALLEEVREQAGENGMRLGAQRGELMLNLGAIYNFVGNYEKGEPILRTAKTWLMEDLGQGHPEALGAFVLMANYFASVGRFNEAIAQLDSGLVWCGSSVDAESSMMGHVLRERGGIYFRAGDMPAALSNYQQTLGIFLKVYGEVHLQTAMARQAVAQVKRGTSDNEGALNENSMALAAYAELFSSGHERILDAGCRVANNLEELGRDSAALDLFKTYLPALTRSGNADERWLIGYELSMARALYRQGELDSARTVLTALTTNRSLGPAEWYMYRIAMDQGRLNDALVHVQRSMRFMDPVNRKWNGREVEEALKDLAYRLNRKDVLEEFDL